MGLPRNGIYVVQGEMSTLLTAMKRGNRWSSHAFQDDDCDSLSRLFVRLHDVLRGVGDLQLLDPRHYMEPFLEVIRSGETTGPVTSLALSAVCKFLSFNLIDPSNKNAAACVENIADAVTRARFVGTDQASDGVVLMKILQVLRVLVLSPVGQLLRDDSVCEIVLSCFRICFETRLSELLRQSAEHCLKDIVQLLFTRLPELRHESTTSEVKKLKIRAGAVDSSLSRGKRKNASSLRSKKGEDRFSEIKIPESTHTRNAENPAAKLSGVLDMQGIIHQAEASSPTLSAVPSLDTSLERIPTETGENGDNNDQSSITTTTTVAASSITNFQEMVADSSGAPPGLLPQMSAAPDAVASAESVNNAGNAVEQNPPPVHDMIKDTSSVVIDMSDSQSSFPELTQSPEDNLPQESPQALETVAVTEAAPPEIVSQEPVNSEAAPPEVVSPEAAKSEGQPPRQETGKQSEGTDRQTDYVNPQGVRFTSAGEEDHDGPLVPYGVLCVRQLFQFLVSLCNPLEKQNSETMQQTGLALLTVALEVGADSISQHDSLLAIVKDNFCRNLFTLMTCERLSLLVAALRASFLVFESMRVHLKFQQERYFVLLADIITTDSPKVTYDHKEAALEALVQLWRIPGLVTELYLNYDCDLYCSNVLEDITKILSRNTFPVNGLYSTHLLSLEALLTVIDSIERHCHSRIQSERQDEITDAGDRVTNKEAGQLSRGWVSRCAPSPNIPSHEQLMAIKRKKKLLATGTEHFNTKPKKGIAFLQDQKLLSTPLDANEVVHFLRENPRLDKKMIGDYISNRENLAILDCFVKSFDFTETRIDEALRLYLETFRLPGEAPLISLLMEHFANHWHKCNGEPFANSDAAFTLAYAVIMLNVDQHNNNVKKQNIPMTPEDFKRNLKKVNGGDDFDQSMLDEIYESIKNDEIVMPAEQSGLVRENYLWKVLLRRGASRDGIFLHAPAGLFDHDLFSLIWGPSVAALSFVFERSSEQQIYQKAITGFLKCALISAHYGMSNDFDNLIISLCKFTTLINTTESVDSLPVCFGANVMAQLATQTVFSLALRYGDILRLGWASVLDCLLQLYRCRLLPKALTEAEDFIEPNKKVSLLREEAPSQKAETGLLSSLYSYIALSSEPSAQRASSAEDIELRKKARQCIRDCHLEQIITESKFLRLDSLQELIKALMLAACGPDGHPALGSSHSESAAVFFLELLLKIIIQNRDRVSTLWPSVRDHLYSLLMGAAACEHHFLMERCVVGLLRLAIGLMRREEMSPVVLQSLRMLLLLKWNSLARVSRNVAYGLYELLKTSAANIHSDADWSVVFTLLECVGAGAPPPRVLGDTVISEYGRSSGGAKSDGELQQLQQDSGFGTERGSTSDSELSRSHTSPEMSPSNVTGSGWILVGREGDIQPLPMRALRSPAGPSWDRDLLPHDPHALVKCCESLAFLVRDVAHITPYNYEYCVHCIRTFVDASLNTNNKVADKRNNSSNKDVKSRKKTPSGRRREESANSHQGSRRARSPQNNPYDADESDSEEFPSGYHQASIQLLDLMHTLHTRTAQIYRWWAEESGDTEPPPLWATGWCPLLQGIARLCCDSRREVCTTAMSYLPRALLVHDLQTLSPSEWESCFRHVLFPLLARLLEPFSPSDPGVVEETRMRAATVLSKVFLHHLTPLLSLPTFSALWFNILDLMQKYMHADHSDLLLEAIPESLKNMLLVMDSAGVFTSADGRSPLWDATWERVDRFLPGMRDELFKSRSTGNVREAHSPTTDGHDGAQPGFFPVPSDRQQEQYPSAPPALPVPIPPSVPSYSAVPTAGSPTAHSLPPPPPSQVSLPCPVPTSSSITVPILIQSPIPSQQQSLELASSTNIVHPTIAPPTTLLPHMGQLVSTPIPGPVPTPACVLEAFTPTARSCPPPTAPAAPAAPTAPPTNFSPLVDDGLLPASRYFVQNQPAVPPVIPTSSGVPIGSGAPWLYRPEETR